MDTDPRFGKGVGGIFARLGTPGRDVDTALRSAHTRTMHDPIIRPYSSGVSGIEAVLREVVRHHADYYARHWGFDHRFESQVTRELAEFMAGFEPARDGFWWAELDGAFAGSVAVDGSRHGEGCARVRWFIVPETAQGAGVGGKLLDHAMEFCCGRPFKEVHLWTFAGLDAARTLYERCGFTLAETAESDGWGSVITEQKFILTRASRRG